MQCQVAGQMSSLRRCPLQERVKATPINCAASDPVAAMVITDLQLALVT